MFSDPSMNVLMAGSANLKINFFKRIWAIQELGGIIPYDSFWIVWNDFKC